MGSDPDAARYGLAVTNDSVHDRYEDGEDWQEVEEPQTCAELTEVAGDWRVSSEDRMRAASQLVVEDQMTGRDLLLAFTVDADVNGPERVAAIRRLLAMDSASVAAVHWLMWKTHFGDLELPEKAEANDLLTGHRLAEQARRGRVDGLDIIVNDTYLDDFHRVWAGVELIGIQGVMAYERIKRAFTVSALTFFGTDLIERGETDDEGAIIGYYLLDSMIADRRLSLAERKNAAEMIADIDPRYDNPLFRALLHEPAE
ncbi:MAG: hypothetical protein ACRDTX_02660 [Pseudonocardiaceae bacterium]